jgi:adenylosuccinate lyase
MAHLSEAELQACFDPRRHLTHLDEIFARLGI